MKHHQITSPMPMARLAASMTASLALAMSHLSVSAADASINAAPNAGSLLRDLQAPQAPAPTAAPQVQAPATAAQAEGRAFEVKRIEFKGNQAIDSQTLNAQAADVLGTRLSMSGLRGLTERLSAFYRSQGYPLSRVVVPQQDVTQGVLTLEVIEARLGQVVVENEGRIQERVLQQLSRPLEPGQVITDEALERALLLMSDTPGAAVSATVKPGQAVGSSDIVIRNAATPLLAGSVGLDTQGNRYTGRTRAISAVKVRNPLGLGDELAITGVHAGDGMQYSRASYELWMGPYGTTVGAACSALHYELGGGLKNLGAHGSANTCGGWVVHPWVRQRQWNLSTRLQFDAYKLRDRVDSSAIRNDRSLDVVTASLDADALDRWGGGGANRFSLSATNGSTRFNNINAGLSDSATAGTAGSFTKVNWLIERNQSLGVNWSLRATVQGQQSDGNLDSSQKLGLGGPGSVRAYDQGAVSGDSGHQASLELRYLLGHFHGPLQASVFFDTGRVRLNHSPWAAVTGPSHVSLSGAGLGLSWRTEDQWSLSLSLATPVGTVPEAVKHVRTGVAWFALNLAF